MLREGNVTTQDLKKIRNHQAHMEKLYKGISHVSYGAVNYDMERRIQELGKVEEQQDYLLHLCQRIGHEVKGT